MGCGSVAPFPRVGDTEPHAIPERSHDGSGTLSVVLFTSTTHGVRQGVASLVQRVDADATCPEHVVASCTIVPPCESKPADAPRSDLGSLAVRDAVGRTRVELRGEEIKHGLSPWIAGERVSITGIGFDLGVAFPRMHVTTPLYVDDNQPIDIANGGALDVAWETTDPGVVDIVLIGHRNAVATCHFDPAALHAHVPIEVITELRGPEGATGWFQITHSQRASQKRGEQQLVVDAITIERDGVLRLR